MALLNRLTVRGVKNLEASCTLTFASKSKVKAVYGSNGAGKTALMISVWMLKQCLMEKDYLVACRRRLMDLINKRKQEVYLSAVFTAEGKKYQYDILLKSLGNSIVIAQEEYYQYGRGADKTPVYKSLDGVLVYLDHAYASRFFDETANLLSQSSFISLVIGKQSLRDEAIKGSALEALVDFARSIQVCLLPGDMPEEPYELSSFAEIPPEIAERLKEAYGDNRHRELLFIPKGAYPQLKEFTDRLKAFIQMFKPELKDIVLEQHQVENDVIGVERIFVYRNGVRINSYLESTGIRALSSAFPFIQAAIDGGIVFIDEMDANANGIFLDALIRYLAESVKGQICFTSHNTHLMDGLTSGNNKYGIAFLSPSLGVKEWARNGHLSPENQWTGGFIPGFAFNYEPLDFYAVFPPKESRKIGEA